MTQATEFTISEDTATELYPGLPPAQPDSHSVQDMIELADPGIDAITQLDRVYGVVLESVGLSQPLSPTSANLINLQLGEIRDRLGMRSARMLPSLEHFSDKHTKMAVSVEALADIKKFFVDIWEKIAKALTDAYNWLLKTTGAKVRQETMNADLDRMDKARKACRTPGGKDAKEKTVSDEQAMKQYMAKLNRLFVVDAGNDITDRVAEIMKNTKSSMRVILIYMDGIKKYRTSLTESLLKYSDFVRDLDRHTDDEFFQKLEEIVTDTERRNFMTELMNSAFETLTPDEMKKLTVQSDSIDLDVLAKSTSTVVYALPVLCHGVRPIFVESRESFTIPDMGSAERTIEMTRYAPYLAKYKPGIIPEATEYDLDKVIHMSNSGEVEALVTAYKNYMTKSSLGRDDSFVKALTEVSRSMKHIQPNIQAIRHSVLTTVNQNMLRETRSQMNALVTISEAFPNICTKTIEALSSYFG